MTAADITMDYVDLRDLRPHEDVIKNKLIDTIISIKETKSVIPIIIDEKKFLIIDGHHRAEAFRILGYSRIPAYAVNYSSSLVRVETWFRRIVPNRMASYIIKSFSSKGSTCFEIDGSKICANSVYEAYWKLQYLELILKRLNIFLDRNPYEGFRPPSLSKQVILDVMEKGLRFPPKTSRHLYDFFIPKDRVKLQ
ncbi:MAG: ParB N-terminal domain-containing protein [Metallosphaera sp.]|uniref:ParB N-terminal domain-containing protein n=1 Tax=Metallosphaera sp. TaxID=2020860 RepID=UPI003161F7E8